MQSLFLDKNDYYLSPLFFNANIVAKDKDGTPILLVDVRVRTMHPNVNFQIIDSLKKIKGKIPFAMLVNPDHIIIFHWLQDQPILTLNTADILEKYEPEFRQKKIFENYLSTLVEAWLRDLAYHWKSTEPPNHAEINQIGLLDKLQNGFTEPMEEIS